MKRTWTMRQVSGWLSVILLLGAGCAQYHSAGSDQAAIGLVTNTLNVLLADAPGEVAVSKSQGSVALLVEQRQLQGQTWSRFITSDGRLGWTSQPLGEHQPVTASLSIDAPALMAQSPDSAEFESGGEVIVRPHVRGRITGASDTARADSFEQLMLPERLRTAELPWLAVEFGNVRGFAALDWLDLSWTPRSTLNDGAPLPAFATTGMPGNGMLRSAFLGPFRAALPALAPAPEARVMRMGALGQPMVEEENGLQWPQAQMLYRDPDHPRRMLVVYRNDRNDTARLFQFLEPGKPANLVVQREYSATVTQVRSADFNEDQALEWLLEVASVYGDGHYLELWHVAANPASSVPTVSRIPLSGDSGESGGTEVVAGWWVDPNKRVWIARSTEKGNFFGYFHYRQGKLRLHRPLSQVWVTVFAQETDRKKARAVALASERHGLSMGVFPHAESTNLSWIAGIPFETKAAAAELARRYPESRVRSISNDATLFADPD